MDKRAECAVIVYLHKRGLSPKAIHEDMIATLGKDAPSLATVKKLLAELKRREDGPFPGGSVTATTSDLTQKINDMVLADCRLAEQHIASAVGISQEKVRAILTDDLAMIMVSACWVPRLLTPDQMRTRLATSRKNLDIYEADPDKFLERFVTMGEIWVHHSQLESKQWQHEGSPQKKAKNVPSGGKIMASVIWDAEGVIMVDYLQKGQAVTGAYYAALLNKFGAQMKAKRGEKLSKGVLFHQDSTPAHTSDAAMAAIRDCGCELVQHPPRSPDLAPSDFQLFPAMKKALSETCLGSEDDVITTLQGFLDSQEKDFYETGIKSLKDRWQKCVELDGDYVEK